jgi:hypothetical protein
LLVKSSEEILLYKDLNLCCLLAKLHVVSLRYIPEVSPFDECELHLANHSLHVLECVDLHLARSLVLLEDLLDRVHPPEVLVDKYHPLYRGLV